MKGGNIIEFKRRGEAKATSKRKDPMAVQAYITRLKTNHDIFQDVTEEILTEWQQAAVNNRLSEYITKKLPAHARGPKHTDYVNDLNAIATVEQKLGMKVAIFSPGTTRNNTYGWLVAFHRGKEIFSTPPDMASEGMARALNILLCVCFERTLKSLGRA